jgi:ketosteroid isomerase-like protein/mannose-6-phosphate isomerase-like protein (cupin superfamily)
MSNAGIVSYKIKQDGSLEGRWTHPALQGKMATERVWGGTPGKLSGNYNVEIYTSDTEKLFEGSLTINVLGEAYILTWSGIQLLPKRRRARFTGIGAVENTDTLVATFQEESPPRAGAALREVWDKIPGPKGERYAEAFTHGTLRVLLYAPRKTDPQEPHKQDEVYVVMKGSGSFTLDGAKRAIAEGDVLFAPARVEHRFEEFTDDLTLWVIFYGPEGGESAGDPREEIERANADFGRAFAKADAKAVSEMYTASAKLFSPNAQIVEGRPAIEGFWKTVMESGITNVNLKTTEVESFGDTVVETGAATLYTKGDVIVDHGKYLVVWKRIEGAWKLHWDCWNSNDPARNG